MTHNKTFCKVTPTAGAGYHNRFSWLKKFAILETGRHLVKAAMTHPVVQSIIICCIHHHSTCCPTLLLKVHCSTPTVVDRHHHVGEGNDLDEREYY